mgnify:FL=1
MAQRRMFSKVITNSSRFLMMPQSAQNLYFHLGMNADDDGFCEHFTIMRMTESKPDDLRILQSKEFVKIFDDKVLIVLDWKENNYVRSDRYTPSRYLKIYKEELELLSGIPIGIPNDNQRLTQDRIGKDRIGKDNTDKREEKTEKNNADSLLEEKLEEKFERFWKEYPRKIAKSVAFKSFVKINPDDNLFKTMIEKLVAYKETEQWQKDKGRFIPHPATWLNQERWQDVLDDDNEEIIVPEYAKQWQTK